MKAFVCFARLASHGAIPVLVAFGECGFLPIR